MILDRLEKTMELKKLIVDLSSLMSIGGFERFEREKLADVEEVFIRGERINEPVLVYSRVLNPQVMQNPYMYDANGNALVGDYNNDKYTGIRNAINNERNVAIESILTGYDERLKKAKAIAKDTQCERAGEFIAECEQLQANNQKSFI